MKTEKPKFKITANNFGWSFNEINSERYCGFIHYELGKLRSCLDYLQFNDHLK